MVASGFLTFPASVGIAVLRFHLYDLDVVVRKKLVVGVLAGFIALVYVAVVAGGTALLGREHPFLSVGAAVGARAGVPAGACLGAADSLTGSCTAFGRLPTRF